MLKKDKAKSISPILNLAISILKSRSPKEEVLLIYVAAENQIRILIKGKEAPILIVLFTELFYKIESSSKSSN